MGFDVNTIIIAVAIIESQIFHGSPTEILSVVYTERGSNDRGEVFGENVLNGVSRSPGAFYCAAGEKLCLFIEKSLDLGFHTLVNISGEQGVVHDHNPPPNRY